MREHRSALQARQISRVFVNGRERTTVLHEVDLTIRPGEFVTLVGPSGSGKSTLLHILGLLDAPTSGEVIVDGRSTSTASRADLARLRNESIGYVFQAYNLLASLTAQENVALPAVLGGVPRRRYESRSLDLLERMGLRDLAGRYPAEMSGGQQQRVGIARALMMEPPLILADEPTGNLDSRSSALVMEMLTGLNQTGQTLVIVTHDPGIAESASRTVTLRDGRIVSDTGGPALGADRTVTEPDDEPDDDPDRLARR
jgi:putative ABC transport system ATP-binding protein